ncbi:helix-turn-helix domain-containing protein [Skermania sp. ID1734]|uniref:helix-turn-helix domain-containing protein n=1 Tax=Skermania sp. ID1734 TaxID=2597516 RepID=UPI00117E8760|nr:helix-turn-helix domain-containing protein [Skermania sp. ID1734]TSE00571.1 helix-turn-helix domain-containing protein [Skermania sp. ID1734]
MTRPDPQKQRRQRVAELADAGLSIREIAANVGASKSTVSRDLAAMGINTPAERTAEAVAANRLTGEAKRQHFCDRLLAKASDALDVIDVLGDPVEAKHRAVVLGVLVDKHVAMLRTIDRPNDSQAEAVSMLDRLVVALENSVEPEQPGQQVWE